MTIIGDPLDEPTETFSVLLSAPTGATVSDVSGTGNHRGQRRSHAPRHQRRVGGRGQFRDEIRHADDHPLGQHDDRLVGEVLHRQRECHRRHRRRGQPATTVTFAAGQTTKTIAVTINGDTVDEPNEAFSPQLSAPTAATISDASATVTIVDEDP